MINYITKFILIFIFIILFLSFKNQTKIIENNLSLLKKNYYNEIQILINKEILLTKQINEPKLNDVNELEFIQDNKIIKFDEMV